MPVSAFGSQTHSISISGWPLINQTFYGNFFGSNVVDLASQPLPPGEFNIYNINFFGSTDIYVPRYVQVLTSGSIVIFGAQDINDKPDNWTRLVNRLQGRVNLPPEPPQFVLSSPNGERPTYLKVNSFAGFGSVVIYRV